MGAELGVPVLLNPAPAAPELDLDRVASVDFFMPNETELALLTGKPVESLDEIKTAAQVLLDTGMQNVIVTLGSRGALWLAQDIEELIESRKVDALDTSGAGDAFIGCFSHYYVETGDIERSLKLANIYAADSVTRRGTQASYADAAAFAVLLEN